jgi:hypothetical protein
MRKIKEQIDYGGRRERMDPNLERKLGDPEGLYAKSPSLKRGEQDVQKLVSSRFGKVVDKLKQVTGIEDLSQSNVKQMLMSEMMRRASQVMNLESRYKPQLKELAVRICLDETEADPSWFIIECNLNESPIDLSNFRYQEEEPKDDEEEEEDDEKPSLNIPSFDIEE